MNLGLLTINVTQLHHTLNPPEDLSPLQGDDEQETAPETQPVTFTDQTTGMVVSAAIDLNVIGSLSELRWTLQKSHQLIPDHLQILNTLDMIFASLKPTANSEQGTAKMRVLGVSHSDMNLNAEPLSLDWNVAWEKSFDTYLSLTTPEIRRPLDAAGSMLTTTVTISVTGNLAVIGA